MSKINCLVAKCAPASGRFIDIDNVLLSLFADPDCRGDQRWPEVFGYARRGTALIVNDSFLALTIQAGGARPIGGALTASSPPVFRMPPRFNPSERGGKPKP